MPYLYLEDVATADVAFKAWGESLPEMFIAAAEATVNVMVAELDSIEAVECHMMDLKADDLEMLLFDFLQEFIFLKDAEQLLLRPSWVEIQQQKGQVSLNAETHGEKINRHKHDLTVDVKAVTLHRFRVEKMDDQWQGTVVLDI